MGTVTIKGNTFSTPTIRDTFSRRAVSFQNKLFATLAKLGIGEDDILLDLEPAAFKKIPASISWYVEGVHAHYSCASQRNYVENLWVVLKVLELEVEKVLKSEKTIEEFIAEFSEDHDVKEQRKEARAFLGVGEEELDLELINKKYKQLAKTLHPDVDGGDTEKFKQLNRAHKLLKKELS